MADFYTLAFSHPSVEAIIYFSGTDLNEWQGSAGDLLDLNHNPKPAYYTLKELIKEKWSTHISDSTSHDGTFTFNEFFGDYHGSIRINNIDYDFNFMLSKDSPLEHTVKIYPKQTGKNIP